jgi:hypothetical protein
MLSVMLCLFPAFLCFTMAGSSIFLFWLHEALSFNISNLFFLYPPSSMPNSLAGSYLFCSTFLPCWCNSKEFLLTSHENNYLLFFASF